MTAQADPALRQHMFALAPLRVWWRLLREHGGVAPRCRGALARILLTSLGTLPLRLAESAVHGRRVRRTPIATPPVMILGYGRSGTTHLRLLVLTLPMLAVNEGGHARHYERSRGADPPTHLPCSR